MSINKRLISNYTVLLILFPFVGFFPGVDVQPFAFIFCFLVALVNFKKIIINYNFLFLFLYMLILVSIYTLFYVNELFFVKEIFFTLSFFTIGILVKNKIISVERKHIKYCLIVYSFVGVVQLVTPEFLTFLVSRSEEQVMMAVDSGRGVRSLTGEPSHLGKIYIILNFLLICMYARKSQQNSNFRLHFYRIFGLSLIFFILNLLLAQSAYMLVMHLLMLSGFVLLVKARFFIMFLFLGLALIVFYLNASDDSSRISFLYDIALNNPELLMQQGAFRRLVNIPIIFNNLTFFGPLGAGASELVFPTSLGTPLGEYFYAARSRNLGGGFEYLLKYGLFAIPVFVFIIYRLSWIFKIYSDKALSLFLFSFLFVILFQDGSFSNPLTLYLFYFATNRDLSSCERDC